MRAWILRIVAANLVIGALWFGLPFLKSPATQALDQHLQLIHFAAHRNWTRAHPLLAEDYRDGWNMKRDEAISVAHEMLQGFLILDLAWKPTSISVKGRNAILTGSIKVSGSGAGFSSEIINRVNQLREPFIFTWRKDGWKPGDWRLVGVSQAELANGP